MVCAKCGYDMRIAPLKDKDYRVVHLANGKHDYTRRGSRRKKEDRSS